MPMAISGQMHLAPPKASKTEAISAVSDSSGATDHPPDFGRTLVAALQPGGAQLAAVLAGRDKLPAGQVTSAAGLNTPLVQTDAANIAAIPAAPAGTSPAQVTSRGATGVVQVGAAVATAPRTRKIADVPQTVPSDPSKATLPVAAAADAVSGPQAAALVIVVPASPLSDGLPVDAAATPGQAVSGQPMTTAAAAAVTAQVSADPAVPKAATTAAAAVNPAALASNPQTAQQGAHQPDPEQVATSVPSKRGGAALTLSSFKLATPVQARVVNTNSGISAPPPPTEADADPAFVEAAAVTPAPPVADPPSSVAVLSIVVDEAEQNALPSPAHSLAQSIGNESVGATAATQPTPPPEMQQSAAISDALSVTRPLASSAAAPSVADQVAPAVISLAQGGVQPGSSRKVSVSITPEELGQVSITVEKAADGTTSIHVAAERLATLDLLRSDQAELSHALNEAGVQQSSSSLSFSWDGATSGGGSHAGQGWANQDWSNQGAPPGQQRPALGSYTEDRSASPGATAAARGGIDVTA